MNQNSLCFHVTFFSPISTSGGLITTNIWNQQDTLFSELMWLGDIMFPCKVSSHISRRYHQHGQMPEIRQTKLPVQPW